MMTKNKEIKEIKFDRQTNRRTDKASCRVACTQLKINPEQ